jgi:cytochrome c peroxidase
MRLSNRQLVGLGLFALPVLVVSSLLVANPSTKLSTTQTTTQTTSLRDLYSGPPDTWPAAHWDESIPLVERIDLGLIPEMTFPDNNPYNKEKAELGRQLFWDPRLSVSNAVACVSCHHPDIAFTDGKSVSQGHELARSARNAPTLLGVGFAKFLMWDGRATSLESQALLPLANPKEMHAEFSDLEARLNAIPEYKPLFKRVFETDKVSFDKISLDHITKALATFQRTLVPGRSRLDSFFKGNKDALTESELRGLHLYRTAARCINCHSGPMMTDQKFHNLGLSAFGRPREDLGRYNITKDPKDVGAFKTPTLRNITQTRPYMHNGLFELEGILNIYNNGGVQPKPRGDEVNNPLFPKNSPLLRQLDLSEQDRKDLLEFLDTTQEPRLRVNPPVLPGKGE